MSVENNNPVSTEHLIPKAYLDNTDYMLIIIMFQFKFWNLAEL